MTNKRKNIVVAVVVTYNRKDMLLECINAILLQTYEISKLILIDNASTDGTREAIEANGYLHNNKIDYCCMRENLGGAGGFYEGIKLAAKTNYDWLWLMDDDTVPQKECLNNLIKANNFVAKSEVASETPPSFFASAIYGPDHSFMNVPVISKKHAPNGYLYWYKYLEKGIVSISSATFVSILINKEAIQKCGFPCKDYFIWGDDTEYTLRLSTFYGDGYFVGSSVAIHKRANAKILRIENERDPVRIDMYHYFFRNQIITQRYYNDNYPGLLRVILRGIKISFSHCKYKPYGFKMAKTILKGYIESIVQYKKFKNFIDDQLNKSI